MAGSNYVGLTREGLALIMVDRIAFVERSANTGDRVYLLKLLGEVLDVVDQKVVALQPLPLPITTPLPAEFVLDKSDRSADRPDIDLTVIRSPTRRLRGKSANP